MKVFKNNKLQRLASFVLVPIVLSACVKGATTRLDPQSYNLIQEGTILPQSGLAFSVCLLDGFDGFRGFSRQTRRTNSYRVDLMGMGGSSVMLSADIFDDGKIKFFESTSSILSTTEPQDVFKSCLSKYAK